MNPESEQKVQQVVETLQKMLDAKIEEARIIAKQRTHAFFASGSQIDKLVSFQKQLDSCKTSSDLEKIQQSLETLPFNIRGTVIDIIKKNGFTLR